MYGHAPVLESLLTAVEPGVVVEIGVFKGATTRLALRITEELGSTVHAIDPAPVDLDLEAFEEEHGGRLIFHRAMSLEALPDIREVDAVLLDGDHNWYTVYNELQTIARVAAEDGRPFPITLMHDVAWPYAHRDMYYDPDTVPAEYRQPYDQAGVLLDSKELADEGGLNAGNHNAVVSGGPRNGVRTAIDDFLAGVDAPVSFTTVIGFFGLGVLYDERQLERYPALRERIAELDSPQFLKQQCRRIERGRVSTMIRLQAMEARHRARTTSQGTG